VFRVLQTATKDGRKGDEGIPRRVLGFTNSNKIYKRGRGEESLWKQGFLQTATN
jgi:hypothetical protein